LHKKLFDYLGVRSTQNSGCLILFISEYTPVIFTVSLPGCSFMKRLLFQTAMESNKSVTSESLRYTV